MDERDWIDVINLATVSGCLREEVLDELEEVETAIDVDEVVGDEVEELLLTPSIAAVDCSGKDGSNTCHGLT